MAADDDERRVEDNALRTELRALLNRNSRENRSNTPDFVLAGVMMAALTAFEAHTTTRDSWYGISPAPGKGLHAGLGDDGLYYVLWSNKVEQWWRADDAGYTRHVAEAGLYVRSEALRRVAQSALSGQLDLVTCMVVAPPGLR